MMSGSNSKKTPSPTSKDEEKQQIDEWMSKINKYQISRTVLDQVVMDYLVREGFKEAAVNFASETSARLPSIDPGIMDQQTAIRNAVESGDIPKAMKMVNDLDAEVLDTKPCLYFHLQQQRLLEYVKEGRVDKALEFAQNQLASCAENNPEVLKELEKAMTLLVFDKTAQVQSGAALEMLQLSQRMKVASELNAAIIDQQSIAVPDRLTALIKHILWCQDIL